MPRTRMKGIDVSYWQGMPAGFRYRRFKEGGWDFIIARIGYAEDGRLQFDSTFEHNYRMCREHGLKVGAYFYSNARNARQGRAEARYVLRLLRRRRLDLPVWIDMEDEETSGRATRRQLSAACRAFCRTMRRGGYQAGVYASTIWFERKIGWLGRLPKWVAQYDDHVSYRGRYDMWQYTDNARVPGFTGGRDANRAYTTFRPVRRRIRRMW